MQTTNENNTYHLSWKNYINWTNAAILLAIILILLLSLFLFTRPNFISAFDFSQTGNIGDTIGGITAPIINIIGAYLVYISFMAQIKANKIQFDMLKDERHNRELERNFEITLNLFTTLKDDLSKLTHGESTAKGAINTFVNQMKIMPKEDLDNISTKNIFSDFIFITNQYYLILYRINTIDMNINEKRQLFALVYLYYQTNLQYPCNIFKMTFSKHKKLEHYIPRFTEIEEMNKEIQEKISVTNSNKN